MAWDGLLIERSRVAPRAATDGGLIGEARIVGIELGWSVLQDGQ